MGFINAENKVPQFQRTYQAAYKSHQRIWRIAPRSTVMYVPFVWIMWGTTGAMMYAMGRKVLGHNTWFSK